MKKKSEFLSALGVMWEIWKSLTDEILSLGGDDEAICLIKANNDLRRQMAELVMAKARDIKDAAKQIVSPYLTSVHDLVIDFSQDLGQMIAAGKYDWTNSDITAEHFPLNGAGKRKVRVELLHFNQYFKNGDEVIAKLKEVNKWLAQQGANYRYRFSRIEEFLALGVVQPGLQRQFPIAALGSIWHRAGLRDFAYLYGFGAERDLRLRCLEFDFGGPWRFAVVREHACR
ncbi:MAG: hypothetical protein WC668_02060 [Patescibacteria group bacterium]|jgi:hypothetical protein